MIEVPVPAGHQLAVAHLEAGAALRLQLRDTCLPAIIRLAELTCDALERGGKLLLLGNGGSAADAQHIAAEFTGRYLTERQPLAALALTTDTSALTAIGNDYGVEHIFARQILALGRKGDVVLAISTSGRSLNITEGLRAATELGLTTVLLTGQKAPEPDLRLDLVIRVPSDSTPLIQECHLAIGHILCCLIDQKLAVAAGC